MPKSVLSKQLDEIQRTLTPVLSARDFRKKGRTYNRSTDDTLIHVVNIQMGPSDPPGTTYIPGLRENMYGLFTINLGVYVPEVADLHEGERPKAYVREYNCSIRARLGELDGNRQDIWWHIATGAELASELESRFERHGFPFLERFSTRDQIVSHFQLYQQRMKLAACSPPRIVSAVILAVRGDKAQANALLTQQARETELEHHRSYVRELAVKLGVGEIAA